MRKLKLIWDFHGPDAKKIAEHHEVHLKEYIVSKGLDVNVTGTENVNELHYIAFMVVAETQMKPVRDALKPRRGQVYNE